MNEEEFKIGFGKNIKTLRIKKKVTQSEVAEAIGIETHNLNRIENGKSFPQIRTIIKLINYFDILPLELFAFDSNNNFQNLLNIIKNNPEKINKFYNVLLAVIE